MINLQTMCDRPSCEMSTSCGSGYARVRAFEAQNIPGFTAASEDGMGPDTPVLSVRITRSTPADGMLNGARSGQGLGGGCNGGSGAGAAGLMAGTGTCLTERLCGNPAAPAAGCVTPQLGTCLAIGQARRPDNGQQEGFLLVIDHMEPVAAVPLSLTTVDGYTSRLIRPTAVTTTRNWGADTSDAATRVAVVVGYGDYVDAGGVVVGGGPAVAVVSLPGLRIQTLTVGNGDATIVDETYTDIITDIPCDSAATTTSAGPYDTPTWLVCGYGQLVADPGEPVVAIVRRLSASTLMALDSAVLDTSSIDVDSATTSCVSASMALVGSQQTPMLVVGVNLINLAGVSPTQAVLWPLNPTVPLSTVLPWTATGYNVGAAAGAPRMSTSSAGVLGVTVLRVLGTLAGDLFVAVLADLDTAASLPQHAAQVYHYSSQTDPDLEYGSAGNGVSTWYSQCAATTRPNDACLLWPPGTSAAAVSGGTACPTASVIVTGNTFAAVEVALNTPGGSAYNNACFPWLSVTLAPSTAGMPAVPDPFAIVFRGKHGMPEPLLNCALRGCAPVLYASTLCAPTIGGGSGTAITLLGDVNFHPGCPGQPAGVLVAALALSTSKGCRGSASKILNANYVSVPVVCVSATGQVSVDAKCAPTSLQVQGPVTVGCSQSSGESCLIQPLPGTLRFDPTSRRLQVYDGTDEWHTLAYEPS